MGEKTLNVVTEEGRNKKMTLQIADINKPLLAVGDLCDQDCLVIFGKRGGFIQNSKGELTKINREIGIYMLSTWSRYVEENEVSEGGGSNADFHRQGEEE